MNQQKACHIRFNTVANKLEELPYLIFKAPTLEKLIYPLSVVTQYDRKNFIHIYETIRTVEELKFGNRFREDFETNYSNFLNYFLDPSSIDYIKITEMPLLSFLYLHPCLPENFGFSQEVCIPSARYINSVYYFNTILSDENREVTFELILNLLTEQVALAKSFYMETSVVNFSFTPPIDVSYQKVVSDFGYYKQVRQANIELNSGDTVAPFICGVNYFSNELWEEIGNHRREILKEYCKIIPYGEGMVTSLKERELSELLENIELINKINHLCGFGEVIKLDKFSGYDFVFDERECEQEYDFENEEFS
jgi:hypothetical protein